MDKQLRGATRGTRGLSRPTAARTARSPATNVPHPPPGRLRPMLRGLLGRHLRTREPTRHSTRKRGADALGARGISAQAPTFEGETMPRLAPRTSLSLPVESRTFGHRGCRFGAMRLAALVAVGGWLMVAVTPARGALPPGARTVGVRGIRIAYRATGSGRPL